MQGNVHDEHAGLTTFRWEATKKGKRVPLNKWDVDPCGYGSKLNIHRLCRFSHCFYFRRAILGTMFSATAINILKVAVKVL